MKIKLVLAIRSLDIGGAERQFIELVKHIDKKRFAVMVVSMYGGVLEREISDLEEITYINLHKKGRYDIVGFYRRYKKLLVDFSPDVIYSFLGEMNLFSLWARPKNSKVIWGFRASNMDLAKYGRVSQAIFWLQKRLSCRVDKIIANSHASVAFHEKEGFCMQNCVVVPNGIDVAKFRFDPARREAFRKRFGLKNDDIAIAIVARIDPMKGYEILSEAAANILAQNDKITFFAVGDGDEEIKRRCKRVLGKFNDRFIWLGRQRDPQNFYSGFDIVVSSSLGEGFSNVIAEAMASQRPCVVTDVGDSAKIVGDCGVVVEPGSARALALGIAQILQKNLATLGECAKERIVRHFSIDAMVQRTQKELIACVE